MPLNKKDRLEVGMYTERSTENSIASAEGKERAGSQ